MFKKKGTAEPITEINLKFNEDKAKEVLCPECKTKLGFKEQNGIYKIASKFIIGTIIVKCTSCKKDIKI
jgi:DNA-directed RNA polymerase subunit RPC12/RpoP